MDAPPPAILARAGMARLKELQRVLRRGGVTSDLVRPPEGNPNA